jgi:hypothetical protein
MFAEMLQHLNAICLGQVQIQQENIRAGTGDTFPDPVDIIERESTVRDYEKLVLHLVLQECFPNQKHIAAIILG